VPTHARIRARRGSDPPRSQPTALSPRFLPVRKPQTLFCVAAAGRSTERPRRLLRPAAERRARMDRERKRMKGREGKKVRVISICDNCTAAEGGLVFGPR
jgi:hypothetical protein